MNHSPFTIRNSRNTGRSGALRALAGEPISPLPVALFTWEFDYLWKVAGIEPWQEETIGPVPGQGRIAFYDNLAAVIRDGAPLTITPESVRDTIAVLETCRRQNPDIWHE